MQEAGEHLMAVTLHAAGEHGAVEHVEGGEERVSAVAFVFVRQGTGAAGLHRQLQLGAVEHLDLTLLFDEQHHRMGRRIDVEADHLAELGHEVWAAEDPKSERAMGCEPMRRPDALHRRDADPDGFGYGRRVQCVASWGGSVAVRSTTRLITSWPSDGTRKHRVLLRRSFYALGRKALLTAPDAGLGRAGPAHDLDRAHTLRREQHDFGAPNVLLGRVAVGGDRLQTAAVGGAEPSWRCGGPYPRLAWRQPERNPRSESTVRIDPLALYA